jgi:UDP-N-acetylmuramyl tripeptide synthase
MGAVGEKLADHCIITADNPRSEDPAAIAAEICGGRLGLGGSHSLILDREAAIAQGLARVLEAGGILLVAGKGHERTQEIAGKLFPFSDGEVVERLAGKCTARGNG